MKSPGKSSLLIALGLAWISAGALAASGPFDGKHFKGRIAYSADGNFNDPDDWSASPISLAILAACGLQEKLVHFDYNCILPETDPAWEKQHATGVPGAAERYGFRAEVFHDCQKNLPDSGMTWFLVSGDEQADLTKYKLLLNDKKIPTTIDPRSQIRLEAENFKALDGCEAVFSNQRQVSQRVHVDFKGAAGRIRTVFHEPYASTRGRYDIDVRHAGGKGGGGEFQLLVGGKPQGAAWQGTGQGWQSRMIPGVTVNEDDEIAVAVQGDAGLDYLQLNAEGSSAVNTKQ